MSIAFRYFRGGLQSTQPANPAQLQLDIPKGTDLMMLYVSYTKGTENGLTLSVQMRDASLSPAFYSQSAVTDPTTGEIGLRQFLMTASGQYRIPVPIAPNEDGVLIEADLGNNPTGNATITVAFAQQTTSRELRL